MTNFRNRIIHAYFGIDDSVLFSAIHDDIKPLLPRVEKLAQESGVTRDPP